MLTRFTVKRIDPLAAGKVLACLHLPIGVLQGIAIGGLTALNESPFGPLNGNRGRHVIAAGLLIVAVPVVTTFLGFAAGVLGSIVYNLSTGLTGGLELELHDNRDVDE